MKIAFLVANYAPSIGGAQQLVKRVAEGLVVTHGHDVEVITTDALRAPGGRHPGRIDGVNETVNGVRVRRFPVARRVHAGLRTGRRIMRRVRPGWRQAPTPSSAGPLGSRFGLAAVDAGRSAHAVIGCSSPFTTILAADLASRLGTAAHIALPLLHLGSGGPPPSIMRALLRADRCVCLTTFERDWLFDHDLLPERLCVISPGCDIDRSTPLDPPEARSRLGLPDRPTVGCIGRLAAYKGIDTLLTALPRLWSQIPECTVLVAGNRSGWDGFDDLIAGALPGAAGRLVVREGVTDEDKRQLLAACDVVAFPSREESFGLVTLEAWAEGRPVVASDIGAARCVIRPEIDGELVPLDSPDRLADCLSALLADPVRAHLYGEAGRRRVMAEFTWGTVIDTWNAVLEEAVARRSRVRV